MTVAVAEIVAAEIVRTGTEWADVIRADLGRAVEGIVSAGRHLIAAKADVQHGEWLPMLHRVGIDTGTASRLMQIARNPAIASSGNCQNLPTALRALHELSQLSPEAIESGIEHGDIHPAMTAKDAKGYAAEVSPKTSATEPGAPPNENAVTDLANGTRNDLTMIANTYGKYVAALGRNLPREGLPRPAIDHITKAMRESLATIEESTNRAIAQIEGA